MFMIGWFMTGEVQGFHYTFYSLVAIQSFFELGLYVVVLYVASHEWTHLQINKNGCIEGEPKALSRLVSLGRFIFKWYGVASILFILCVGIAGHFFLSQESYPGIDWEGPWWALIVLSGFSLWALPFNSLLEGCDQVANIQKFRLGQMILRSLGMWFALAMGWGLWASVVAVAAAVFRDVYLFGVEYRNFFRPFFSLKVDSSIDWKTEIWPMQSRLALGGIFSYFLFAAFVPVMFHFHGPILAGQMGMTLSVVALLQGLAGKWIHPKRPQFGMLIAKKDYKQLDQVWFRTLRITVLVAVVCAGVSCLGIYLLNVMNISLAERMLPPLPSSIFIVTTIFMAAAICQTAYLRAHKKEPLLGLSIVTSLIMGILTLVLGSRFGALGAAVAYLIVMGFISLPWETFIWFRCRAEWHRADANVLEAT
tara:strand:- start:4367 stop:5632 length:1266 start_codon:yes stop_codon:yes gene_type:complete